MPNQLKKSLVISTSFLLISFGSMLFVAIYLLQQASMQSARDAWQQAQSSIEYQLSLNVETINDNIQNHIARAIETPVLLALMASRTVERSEQLSRNQLKTLVAEALRANLVANAAYIHFEPDAYDGLDQLNKGKLEHSSNEGTLEIYWVKQQQGLQHYAVPDPSFKYQEQPDAFGQSESAWFLCPARTRQYCITAPFWWELEPGLNIQLISVTLPVLYQDKLLGVAGVDLNMPEFNASISEFIRPLYSGSVRFFLLTEDARILASNDYAEHLGESLAQVAPDIAALLAEREQRHFMQGGQDFLVERLQLNILNTGWQMLLLIPQHILLNEFTQARADYTKLSMRNMTVLILSSGLLILFTMAIALSYIHRRERLLEQSEAELELILKAAPTPISVAHSQQGQFVLHKVNQAWLDKFGFRQQEQATAAFADFSLWSSATDKSRLMQQIAQDGQVSAFVVWLKQHDQVEFLAEVSATLVLTGDEPLLVMVYDDISEYYALQCQLLTANDVLEQRVLARTQALQNTISALARTQRELIQSEKLAALGHLVAGVAHELNTPVGNAVMAASQLRADYDALVLKTQKGLTKSDFENFLLMGRQSTDILDRNLQRAAELIRSFKQVAIDQTSLQRRQAYIKDILEDVLLMLQPSIRKSGHTVSLQMPETPILLDSYPGPLEQVLINLVQNALLHAFEQEGGLVMITVTQQDSELILTVADNGNGIPLALQSKIFEPFFTTRLGQGGAGLGLSLVHNMVTGILKGQLGVESSPGAGCRFWVKIPLTVPES